MNLLGKRIVFKKIAALEKEQKQSVIITVREDVKTPLIIGEVLETGHEIINIKKGSKILVNEQMADKMIWDNEECLIILAENIIAFE